MLCWLELNAFEDPDDPWNFRKTIGKIMSVQYKIPDHVHISWDCKQLLSLIFVSNPMKIITISEIKASWFLKNLPLLPQPLQFQASVKLKKMKTAKPKEEERKCRAVVNTK